MNVKISLTWHDNYKKLVEHVDLEMLFEYGKKSNFHEEKNFDPFWGFTLKTVLGIHDPRLSWLVFGTKNHEMQGPPVHQNFCL